MRKFFLLLLCSICSLLLYAQSRTVAGKVTDEGGTGLSGISVLVKGSTTGTTTDRNGNFQINASPAARWCFRVLVSKDGKWKSVSRLH
jgi:hypothetical protein